MPVIVVGADTEYGRVAASALTQREGEVRAFVTDPDTAPPLRELGIKVAIGDISDGSHVEGAALQAFSAVLVAEAARDDRERSFAPDFESVVAAWFEAVREAGVQRVIWMGSDSPPVGLSAGPFEAVAIDTSALSAEAAAAEAVRLDDLAELP